MSAETEDCQRFARRPARCGRRRVQREQHAEEQLPCARGQREEVRQRVRRGRINAQPQRHEDQRRKRPNPTPVQEAKRQEEQDGCNEVVLFLDRQRPGVKQRPEGRIAEEVSGVPPEIEVGKEQRRVRETFGKRREEAGRRDEKGADVCCEQDERQRREDAARSALIECQNGEPGGLRDPFSG